MVEFLIIVAGFIVAALFTVYFNYDPLVEHEPITDEELLLLTLVDDKHQPALLTYVRTLNMSNDLQDYLKDKKEALESISYYMLTQSAKVEQEKKDKWEKSRVDPKVQSCLSYNERMILQRMNAHADIMKLDSKK